MVASCTQGVLSIQIILWHLDDFDTDVQVRPIPPPPPPPLLLSHTMFSSAGKWTRVYIHPNAHTQHTFSLSLSQPLSLTCALFLSVTQTNAHTLQASRHVDLCAQPWVLQFCATCIFLTLMLNNVPVLRATLFFPALSLSQSALPPLSPSLTPTVPCGGCIGGVVGETSWIFVFVSVVVVLMV
jgi:hypothetical protein